MKFTAALLVAVAFAVVVDNALAEFGRHDGPRGLGRRGRKMRRIYCEVTNSTSGESCTASCPSFMSCVEPATLVTNSEKLATMIIKICRPQTCDPEAVDACPEGATCMTKRRKRTVSFCFPENMEDFAADDDDEEERCELPWKKFRALSGKEGRPGGARGFGRGPGRRQ